MAKPKFDNGAVGRAKAIGTFLKETARVATLKPKIEALKHTNANLRRMRTGKALTAKDSMGLARAVSKKVK